MIDALTEKDGADDSCLSNVECEMSFLERVMQAFETLSTSAWL